MAEVASAYVTLLPSARGWDRQVSRQIGAGTDKAGRASGQRAGKAFSGGFSGAIKGVVAAAGGLALGNAAVNFFTDSISGASDLNETLSKSRIIFGKNADDLERWAKAANDTVGLSDNAALSAATSFGDMFSQIGFGAERTAKMSKGVVQLAADLGSFNNLETEDVLERIAGGFRGEYDALQKVIPNISAARVQQEALNRTQKESVSDLTAAEKAEATLAIIRKDGARATGDFARTSDGLANSQKILKSRTEDLKAAVGKGLLPVTTEIVNKTSDFVDGMQKGTGAGGEFVEVLEDARDVGKGVLNFFESIPGPVKKYGAQLVLAAFALNKVNDSLVSGRNRMTAWLDSMGPAQAQMSRTRRAAYGLGVGLRNVAGAGGMLAVVDGANRSNKALGALETTAGAAAAGFAVGGPIGAAIGGAAGYVYSLASATRDAGGAAEDTIPSWKTYASTLDDVSAASSKATREMVLSRLEKDGTLKATRELGIADRDVIQSTLGNEAARRRLTTALQQATASGKNYQALQIAQGLRSETGAIQSSRVEQLKKNLALAATAEEAERIQRKLDKLGRTNATPQVRLDGGENVLDQLTAIQQLIKEISSSSGGIDAPADSLTGLLGGKTPRALGGPVRPGETYLVGERGPELFTTSQRGRITSNSDLRTATATSAPAPQFIVERVYAQDVNDFLRQMQVRARHSTLDGIR